MAKHRNPLQSGQVSGKMDEKMPLSAFWALPMMGVLVLAVAGINWTYGGPAVDTDSSRVMSLTYTGWFWLNRGWSNEITSAQYLDSAKTYFRVALRMDPANSGPHMGLGWAYYYSDSAEKAIREFKMAKGKNPIHPFPYMGLGFIYKDAKKWKEAERELRKAVAVWPYHYNSKTNGDMQKALDFTQQDREYQKTVACLAEVLGRQGKQEESKLWNDSANILKIRSKPMYIPMDGLPLPPRPCSVSMSLLGFARDSLLFRGLPQIKDTAKIVYPPIAHQAEIAGSVWLILSINGKGEVVKTQISRSSRNEALDEAAKGLSNTKFTPPRWVKKVRKGKSPPTCDLLMQVNFQILDYPKK